MTPKPRGDLGWARVPSAAPFSIAWIRKVIRLNNRVAPLPQSGHLTAPEALLNSFLFKRVRLIDSEYLIRSQKCPGHYWVAGRPWISRFISLNFRFPLRAATSQGCCTGGVKLSPDKNPA